MKSKNMIIAIIVLLLILVISMINSSITGYAIADVTGEFPGLGIFLVILLGIIGMHMIKAKHDKK